MNFSRRVLNSFKTRLYTTVTKILHEVEYFVVSSRNRDVDWRLLRGCRVSVILWFLHFDRPPSSSGKRHYEADREATRVLATRLSFSLPFSLISRCSVRLRNESRRCIHSSQDITEFTSILITRLWQWSIYWRKLTRCSGYAWLTFKGRSFATYLRRLESTRRRYEYVIDFVYFLRVFSESPRGE